MQSTNDVRSLLESVQRLPDYDQDLLVDFLNLLTKAQPTQQYTALQMLSEILDVKPESYFECINELIDIMNFLRTGKVAGRVTN